MNCDINYISEKNRNTNKYILKHKMTEQEKLKDVLHQYLFYFINRPITKTIQKQSYETSDTEVSIQRRPCV